MAEVDLTTGKVVLVIGGTLMAGYMATAITRIQLAWPWRSKVKRWSDFYRIQESVVLAVIARESAGKSAAIGDGGEAIGLMQVRPIAFKDIQQWDPLIWGSRDHGELRDSPDLQIAAGTAFLSKMFQDADGQLLVAIDAYNRGLSRATGFSDYAMDVAGMAMLDAMLKLIGATGDK